MAEQPAQRLFVSIDPSAQALEHLGGLVDGLRVSLANAPGHSTRLTRRENWHITVAFLGDVPGKRVPVASSVVQQVASAAAPMHLCVAGGGAFGGRRDPIVWAGIGGETEALRRLARSLQRALQRAGLPCDDRPPRPHLTIARPGQRVSPEDVAADLLSLAAYRGPRWTATALHVMLSEIEQSPTGPRPRYTVVSSAPLGG